MVDDEGNKKSQTIPFLNPEMLAFVDMLFHKAMYPSFAAYERTCPERSRQESACSCATTVTPRCTWCHMVTLLFVFHQAFLRHVKEQHSSPTAREQLRAAWNQHLESGGEDLGKAGAARADDDLIMVMAGPLRLPPPPPAAAAPAPAKAAASAAAAPAPAKAAAPAPVRAAAPAAPADAPPPSGEGKRARACTRVCSPACFNRVCAASACMLRPEVRRVCEDVLGPVC
jgi:hypothetical protein